MDFLIKPSFSTENYIYPGFHRKSSCKLQFWEDKDFIIVTHKKHSGTPPMLAAESLASQAIQDFKIRPNKLIWINHVPAECSTHNKNEYSRVTFKYNKKKRTFKLTDTKFDPVELGTIKDFLKGYVRFISN